MPTLFSGVLAMSTYQVAALVSSDDIEGTFRTSLRSSSASRKSSNGSQTKRDNSNRDSAISSFGSVASFSSSSGSKSRLHRRSRSAVSRSRSRVSHHGNVNSLDYDASIHNDTPMVERYNQHGELFPPVSHAWQAFKERLYDSAFSEKYETMQWLEEPKNNRRFRSVSPVNFGDEEEESNEQRSDLFFLRDPLSRSVYKNFESFFDRKSLIRSVAGYQPDDGSMTTRSFQTSRSARRFSTQNGFGGDTQRAQSSMDFLVPMSSRNSSRGQRSNLDPPRSHTSMETSRSLNTSSNSFFSRRKKERPVERAQSEERPDEIRKQIQQRFAKIDFEEGTTDYDALFTVSEENAEIMEHHSDNTDKKNGNQADGIDGHLAGNDDTPKAKLEHLRY